MPPGREHELPQDTVVLTFPAHSDEEPRVVTCTRVGPTETPLTPGAS